MKQATPLALEFQGVSKGFDQGANRVVTLENVDFSMARGEFVALVGPSGSGKSTLLHLAGGIDEPDRGRITIDGVDLNTLNLRQRSRVRRERIGFVFQFFQLLPTLTVKENVELPLTFARDRSAPTKAMQLLDQMGLGDKAHRYPSELSGGEMQRVAIARALVADAPLILADEPTGNLDSITGADVMDLLTGQVREAGAALLLVTHDDAAAARADRVLALRDSHLNER